MALASPRARKALQAILTVVIIVAVASLFAASLVDSWQEVRRRNLGFSPLWIVAVVLFAAAVPMSGLLWGAIVDRLAPAPFRVGAIESMSVHVGSWLLKYIPGQVGSLVSKVLWGGRRGLSRTVVVISFLYENVFLQLASIVPSALVLIVVLGLDIFRDNPLVLVFSLLALVPLLIALVPQWLRATMNIASRRLLKRELPDEYFLRTGTTAMLLAGFLGPRVVNGTGFVIVAASFMNLTASDWLLFASAYVLAGAIGILAVFVPSGLGVREAVIFTCLVSGGVVAADAVIAAVLARLISSLADGLLGVFYAVTKLSIRKDRAG